MRAEAKIQAAVAPALMPDETFLAARVCLPAGVGTAALGGVLGGAVGAVAVTAVHAKRQGTARRAGLAARIPASKKVAVVITTHRLLVFGLTPYGAGVRQPILGVGRRDLLSVEVHPAKIGFAKLRVGFGDGSTVDLKLDSDRKLDELRQAVSLLGSGPTQAR
jgi:hypothetical protein